MRTLLLSSLLVACRVKESELPLDSGTGLSEEETGIPAEDSGTEPASDLDGDGFSTEQGDCDDDDATLHPGADEVCDGLDQDCDGSIDEGVLGTFYADSDGDGHGDAGSPTESCEAGASVENDDDCDDTRADVHPDAQELCDGVDSDCDGAIDEDGNTLWYDDADADGYGDAATADWACDPDGRVSDATDCDDADATIHPGAEEVCDRVDQDCDGTADDGLAVTWYIDYDSDGYGSDAYLASNCTQPDGWVATDDDCDDTESEVNPGEAEVCNEIDDDCDGTVDEDDASDASTWYADADGDGHGDPTVATVACEAPEGTVADATDCDDTDATVWDGAVERYDGLDNDCDGVVDDNTWIGSGADGALVVTGSTDLSTDASNGRAFADGVAYAVSALSGSDVTLTEDADGIAAGDEVLLLHVHGSDSAHAAVGSYEFAWVAAVSGGVVTLDTPIAGTYGEVDNSDLSDQAIVLQRVPQYTSVTVEATGLLSARAWDGATGGVVALRATGEVIIAGGGAIVADELGYAGGSTGTAFDNDAFQGESWAGEGDGDQPGSAYYNQYTGEWANNYGGGGANVTGGGGEHAGDATAGDSWTGGGATAPEAGDTYGEPDLSVLFFGSGGGGVWFGYDDPGAGGSGGGIVYLGASAVTADGAAAVTALGGTTSHWATGTWTYGAGGGAGGSLWILADTLTLAADALDAGGGLGESTHIRAGGDGGRGRVRVDCNEINGSACDDAAGGAELETAAHPNPEWSEVP